MEESSVEEIKLLLGGAIPEKRTEMEEYLQKYAPHIARCDDRPGFTVEAGAFGILKFTQRTMHQMWILGFAANQALHSYSSIIAVLWVHTGEFDTNHLNEIPEQNIEEEKYENLIYSVYALSRENNTADFAWPNEVPSPENKKPTDVEGSVVFDLVCMSGAFVFLHEMKHIAFSIDGNAPKDPHEEELACDSFAKNMMLDSLNEYSEQSGYDLAKLYSKRTISISLALFFMLVITPVEAWSGTEKHPSIKTRIESLVNDLPILDNDILWLYMSSLFLSHLRYLSKSHIALKFQSTRELAMKLVEEIENASNKRN